jgi:hypothetical protein
MPITSFILSSDPGNKYIDRSETIYYNVFFVTSHGLLGHHLHSTSCQFIIMAKYSIILVTYINNNFSSLDNFLIRYSSAHASDLVSHSLDRTSVTGLLIFVYLAHLDHILCSISLLSISVVTHVYKLWSEQERIYVYRINHILIIKMRSVSYLDIIQYCDIKSLSLLWVNFSIWSASRLNQETKEISSVNNHSIS